MSPTDQLVVRSGGWNASVSVALQSINGFDGTVSLSADTTEPAIVVNFDRNPVPVNSSGSPLLLRMNVSVSPALPLGKYSAVLTAQGNGMIHQISFKADVRGALSGVMSILRFDRIGRISTTNPLNCPTSITSIFCFSAQQNFLIEAPNGTIVFVVQNMATLVPLHVEVKQCFVIVGCLHATLLDAWAVRSKIEAWDRFHTNLLGHPAPVLEACGVSNAFAPNIVHTPFALNFTSVIVDNKLIMSNNASRSTPISCNAAGLTIPDNSFIVG